MSIASLNFSLTKVLHIQVVSCHSILDVKILEIISFCSVTSIKQDDFLQWNSLKTIWVHFSYVFRFII